MKKDCYFKIVAGILPIVLILLLEGGLRLVGFGNKISLFDQEGKQDYLLHLNNNESLRNFLK